MGILPAPRRLVDRAYAARVTRKSWLMSALFVVVGSGFTFAFVHFGHEVITEHQLWQSGEAGEIQELSWQLRASGKAGVTIFYDYTVDVAYLDQTGQLHQGHTEFDLVWSPVADEFGSTRLRYDRADPSRFALSSSAEAGAARWAAPVLFGVLGAMMWLGLVLTRRTHATRLRWFEQVAFDGEEILAPLHGVQPVPHQGFQVSFSLPGDPKKRKASLEE